MQTKTQSLVHKFSLVIGATLLLALAVLAAAQGATAQTATYRVIHDLNGQDGNSPIGDLITDASGNLYGVTKWGVDDNYSCGYVFKLTPASGGAWKTTVLHTFNGALSDCNPWAGLVMDGAGNLYGTAVETYGYGAVYELLPTSAGGWNYSVIFQFTLGSEGIWPTSKLALDAAGNLYGTTSIGGSADFGDVFELSPTVSGGWNETVLYSFTNGSDGGTPVAGLTFDAAGNLYGTTQHGGSQAGVCAFSSGCGVVFKLSTNSSGGWSETTLHTFSGTDGAFPQANLILDASGNLYGMTYGGGNVNACTVYGTGCGVAFKLSPRVSGGWMYSVILKFQPGATGRGGEGGAYPVSGLTLDAAGNLWGTTTSGGFAPNYSGVVFKLSPHATGEWTETVVHGFSRFLAGIGPYSGVVLNTAGKLFGTTAAGGAPNRCTFYGTPGGCGVVFEITP